MASRIHTKGATSGYFRVHTMIMSQSWRIPIESNGPMDQWFVTEMYALKTAVFQRRIQDSLEPMTCIGWRWLVHLVPSCSAQEFLGDAKLVAGDSDLLQSASNVTCWKLVCQVSPGGFNGGLVIMLRGRKAGTLRLATWQQKNGTSLVLDAGLGGPQLTSLIFQAFFVKDLAKNWKIKELIVPPVFQVLVVKFPLKVLTKSVWGVLNSSASDITIHCYCLYHSVCIICVWCIWRCPCWYQFWFYYMTGWKVTWIQCPSIFNASCWYQHVWLDSQETSSTKKQPVVFDSNLTTSYPEERSLQVKTPSRSLIIQGRCEIKWERVCISGVAQKVRRDLMHYPFVVCSLQVATLVMWLEPWNV